MNRKAETFFDAITHLREDLVEEAQNYRFHKRTAVWKKLSSLAACLLLIMSIGALAMLPRGCGSSGGNSAAPSANNNSGTAAPQEAPASSDTAPPMYGIGSDAPAGGPENGSPSDAAETYQFIAVVIELQDEAILVEPIEYDSHYQWLIPTANLEYPALVEGDWITVTYVRAPALTVNPPVLQGVQSIEKTAPTE